MANQSTGKNNTGPDKELIRQFFYVEKKKAENKAQELEVRKNEISQNTEYAKYLAEKQHDLLKNKPRQDRYNYITYAVITFVFILIMGASFYYLLESGKDQLVWSILEWSFKLVVLAVTFIAGRLSKRIKTSNDTVEDATEVID